MQYKLVDHQGLAFMVMSAHDHARWLDHLNRLYDDSAEAGNAHIHVRLNGQDHTFATVDEYLGQLTVRDISEAQASVLAALFPVAHEAHHAWYGQKDIFRPYSGK